MVLGEFSPKARAMFLFGRPALYFRTIDHLLIVIAFYMALWVAQFTYSCNVFDEPEASAWRVLTSLHFFLSVIYTYTCICTAVLLAGARPGLDAAVPLRRALRLLSTREPTYCTVLTH